MKISNEQKLAIALAIVSLVAPFALKPYVDTFAFGKSFARVYGVGVYFLLLAFVSPLLARHAGWLAPKAAKMLLILLLAIFIFGLWGQLHFISSLGGGFDDYYMSFGQGGYTGSQITHIHAAKVIFCPFIPDDSTFDCARQMLGYLPPYYPLAGLLMWLAAGALAVAAYSEFRSNHEKFAYFILSFSALRTSVDGGMFNYSFVCFPMLAAFILIRKNRLAGSVIGFALGAVFFTIAPPILFSFPISLLPLKLLPFCMFFFSIAYMLEDPKKRYPLLAIALLSPLLLEGSEVLLDRWTGDPCSRAMANSSILLEVNGRLFSECNSSVSYWCGNVTSGNGSWKYTGFNAPRLPLIISSALSQGCGSGVYAITNATRIWGGIGQDAELTVE